MMTLFETIGPAIWRASWQGAVLALFIVLLVRSLGERLAPRWRYLLWSVVLVRLLLIITPASPWSVFNLAGASPKVIARPIETAGTDMRFAPSPNSHTRREIAQSSIKDQSPQVKGVAQDLPASASTPASTPLPARSLGNAITATAAEHSELSPTGAQLVLCSAMTVWCVGCLWFGFRLVVSTVVLRQRLSACRPITDAAILQMLATVCRQIGMRRIPVLLVTPESISPCLTGIWNPRIIVPESIVTAVSTASLRHVLAHELAHLVRGDLWTNWQLVTARILHWYNPIAWWTIREMQAEREAACDELAIGVLGEADRSAYAATIIDLASTLAPSCTLAPAMIGLISSARRLRMRVERLVRVPSVTPVRTPLAAVLFLGIALIGLTDTMPASAKAAAAPPANEANETAAVPAKPVAAQNQAQPKTITLSGTCQDFPRGPVLAGAEVRLFKVEGSTAPIVEIAKTVSDREGKFEFPGLIPPRPFDALDKLIYFVAVLAENRPLGGAATYGFPDEKPNTVTVRVLTDTVTLSGKVVDVRGQPIAGATVAQWIFDGRTVPSVGTATTAPDGRFEIKQFPYLKTNEGAVDTSLLRFSVLHPDYPEVSVNVAAAKPNVTITMPDGCKVTGTAIDSVTDKPAAGVLIVAHSQGLTNQRGEFATMTDANGAYRMVLREDRYHFTAESADRTCVALTDRECRAGESVELTFRMIEGGFIAGQVVDTATGQPVAISPHDKGHPVTLGNIGPARPYVKGLYNSQMAKVDAEGRYKIRVAPGDNFPYLYNTYGDREYWVTLKQPPVVVKEGQTTTYNLTISPKVTPAEKLQAARAVAAKLPKPPRERTAAIIREFRKLDRTVDETELWCLLMQELVTVGPDAVPQLCAELDQTTSNATLRRLAFALRAIGDPRAVPALIRAIPRTLLPASSDYGLIVADESLSKFMQQHDLDPGQRSQHFDLGRPEREILGTIRKLTKHTIDSTELSGISQSEDPRRQVFQRRLFLQHALKWQTWWEAHWQEFTKDAAYQLVKVPDVNEAIPPAAKTLSPTAHLGTGFQQGILSPAIQQGQYAWHFLDLETGLVPKWPAHIPQDEAKLDQKQLTDWAMQNGVDLMCITYRAPDGKETFQLRTFGMQAKEISARDFRNLDKLVAAGKLPEGRDVGELLMHYDAASEQLVPNANGAFLFTTSEGSIGVIEITGRITHTADLTGLPAEVRSESTVGLFKGVRLDLKEIVP